jgi:hypothetical protein
VRRAHASFPLLWPAIAGAVGSYDTPLQRRPMVQTRRILRPDCLSSFNRPWEEHTRRPRFVPGVSRHAWVLSPADIPSVDSTAVCVTTCRRLEHKRVGRRVIACYIVSTHTKVRRWSGDTSTGCGITCTPPIDGEQGDTACDHAARWVHPHGRACSPSCRESL